MIFLTLSALAGMCDRDERIAAFTAHYGYAPGEASTWAQWCAVTPEVGDRLWAAAAALPCAYPEHAAALRRAVVEVAYRAAMRVLPVFEASRPGDDRPAAALRLVRRRLDGETVTAADLWTAAAYAAHDDDAAYAAYATVHAAAYAADYAAHAAYATAVTATDGAADAAADGAAERERQRADIDELLHGLLVEVPVAPFDDKE